MADVVKSNVVDFNSPAANQFGCQPCPQCKSKFRFQLARSPDRIECDDCGFAEKAAPKEVDDDDD